MKGPLPQISEELCIRCGLCVESCACLAVELGEQGPVFHCAEVSCPIGLEGMECACLCEEVCPTGAIQCAYEIVLEDSQRAGMA